jgi:limonene-1,2-epoxide hydrolase
MESSLEPQPVVLFKEVFARLTPETQMPLTQLYAAEVTFEDPMHKIVGLEALAKYFARLNARIQYAEFVFESKIVTDDQAALTWKMVVRPKYSWKPVEVPGVSILRFTDKIVYQRDYFDVGAMMYEQLPIFGWVLRRLKSAVSV